MPKKARRQHDGMGWHLSSKGYPRFNNEGPRKGEYIHRYEAAKMLGRPLRPDEEIHHRNFNKMDWSHSNLKVMGIAEHSWLSARQAFWMRVLDVKAEENFYAAVQQLEHEGVSTGLAAGAGA